MLLHIRPRLFSPFKYVELFELEIEPLGLHLRGGIDLATRRPYPNRHYAVACRKEGKKAIDGILLDTATVLDEFRATARWAVEAQLVVSHHVDYKILDHDFDSASDDMTFWYACGASLGGWSNRCPAWTELRPCVMAPPTMEVLPRDAKRKRIEAREDFIDKENGFITTRHETFAMPTIEKERLLSRALNERMPLLTMAFR